VLLDFGSNPFELFVSGELILNLDADLRVQVNINTPVKLLIIISVFIASEFIQCLPNVL
jgi:hypothetical protein